MHQTTTNPQYSPHAMSYATPTIAGMPSATLYQQYLTSNAPCLRERHDNRGFPFSERHLQCVWADNHLRPAALTTHTGEVLAVLDPGRWNLEAGPDFLDAVLLLGPEQRRVCGDVEIHIQAGDWNHHNHAADPRYQRIIAHVTYTRGNTPPDGLPPGTVEVSLREPLAGKPAFTFEAVDVTAYPYAALPDSPRPCAIVLQEWNPDHLPMMLEAAGAHRMQLKAERLAIRLENNNPDGVLYREILGALGYKQNTALCRELADRVPYEELHDLDPLTGYAVLLGVSGLLPVKPSPRWDFETRQFIRKVWDAWWPQQARWQSVMLPKRAWMLASIRPQNHPVRRLAAAAACVCHNQSLHQRLAAIGTDVPADWRANVTTLFDAPTPLDYWHNHISLGSPRRPNPIAIIGKPRLSALCANVLYPFLAATGIPTEALITALPPEQSNTIIRQTAHALFGRDHNPILYDKHGLRQQGLMQIFHDFCLNNRSGCRDCPFPAALRTFSAGQKPGQQYQEHQRLKLND